MADGLQIYVLGSPILQFDQRPLTADLISLKGQALLIYLAVTGKAQPRTTLAGLLWGSLPEASARANLRFTLSKLRKFLPETILLTTRLDVSLAKLLARRLRISTAFTNKKICRSQFTIRSLP